MHPILFHTSRIRNKLVCPKLILEMLPKIPPAELISTAQTNIHEIVESILEIEKHAI